LAVAVPFYLSYFLNLSPTAEKLAGVSAIFLLTASNCLGVRCGASIHNALTMIKVVTLILMSALLLLSSPVSKIAPQSSKCDWTWSSLGLAAIAALWAYEGWHLVTFAGAEVTRPEKNLPRGLITGMTSVLLLYLAANAGYLHVLTIDDIQNRTDVAALSMEAVVGRSAGGLVAAMILFSALRRNSGRGPNHAALRVGPPWLITPAWQEAVARRRRHC
jgi:APA family basic amino acid/polyamine antiporter